MKWAFILGLILSIFATCSFVSAYANVYISPSLSVLDTNKSFSVGVSINTSESVYAAEFQVFFNPSVVNASSIVQGNFLNKDGASVLCPVLKVNNTIGKILFACTRMVTPNGVTGKGNLSAITFYTKNAGTSRLDLSNVMISDDSPEPQPINATIINGTVKVRGNFSVILKQGWNLMSIPLSLDNQTIGSIFRGIEFKKIFNYTSGRWYELNNNSIVNETKGYWVNSLKNQTLNVRGIEFDSVGVPFKKGWNLAGYPYLNGSWINETFKGSNYTLVYGYNGNWSSYVLNRTTNSLTMMKPGYGYWVKIG